MREIAQGNGQCVTETRTAGMIIYEDEKGWDWLKRKIVGRNEESTCVERGDMV